MNLQADKEDDEKDVNKIKAEIEATDPSPHSTHLNPLDEKELLEAENRAEETDEVTANNIILKQMEEVQMHALDEQQKSRPLLHQQEKMEEDEGVGALSTTITAPTQSNLPVSSRTLPSVTASASATISNTTASENKSKRETKHTHHSQPRRRPLLVDNDTELEMVSRVLEEVHHTFYDRRKLREKQNQKSTGDRGVLDANPADVRKIMPEMKYTVLAGTRILFSSVIPLGQDPRRYVRFSV